MIEAELGRGFAGATDQRIAAATNRILSFVAREERWPCHAACWFVVACD
jgi:hypothetical protein